MALTEVQGQVAQLGYVHVLPVRNRTFGATAFNAEFTPAGGLRSVGYNQTSAPAEGATGALTSAAGVLDPTARLQRETAYLEALQARRAAADAFEPQDAIGEERTALKADTSLLEARAANLEAQIALERLRAQLQDD